MITICRRPLVALALFAPLTGCVDNGSRPDGGAPTAAERIEPEQIMVPDKSSTPGSIELSAGRLAPVIADLARRVGAAEGEIRVLRAIPVVWNDGSLGCPQPGQAYTQALVPGQWVVLEHDGRRYSYHAGSKGAFRLCEKIQPDPLGAPPRGRYDASV